MDATLTLDPTAAYRLWAPRYPPHAHNPLMLAEERAMLAFLPTRLRGKRVLDAGCGSGRYLIHARRRGASHIIGADLSPEMLSRASHESGVRTLVQATLAALPLRHAWADITICGLTIGHLEDLQTPLAELRRVTRPGGLVLVSDFHPLGAALGWRREFSAGGSRYAVRHTPHTYPTWRRCCAELGLDVVAMQEPFLHPADIPPGATFDQRALQVPVALVFALRRRA
jgi:malonyl-CoA O-methyltransferase